MKELTEYRSALLRKLMTSTEEFQAACLSVQDPFATLEADGWNVHQIATHTRDVNLRVYGLRARRTATEDNPEFKNFDGDAYMREHYSTTEPLEELLAELAKNITELVAELQDLPAEAWSRVSRHETFGGGLTLQTWVERGLAHMEEHLATVKRAQPT